ncbi:MAG: YkgJ family cysteine cluster protein [Thaumarchaeota archaeon]|nr:YkgJ family cysteine cluster protein [Nitrososphaerota archaeon]
MISFKRLCDNCASHGCCTDSTVPLVFSTDFEALKSIGKAQDLYIQELDIKGRKVKALKKKQNSSNCVFWNEEKKLCSIYEQRPFDCRAYPFDILFVEGKFHWIVYSCNPDSNWEWSEKYLERLEKDMEINKIFDEIASFADNTDLILPDESKKTPYTVLREVRFPKLPKIEQR